MDKIPYFHQIEDDNKTISIDMITIKADIKHGYMSYITDYLDDRSQMYGTKPKVVTAPNRYHWFYQFCYDLDGLKFRCNSRYEIGQNNMNGTISERVKIIFNPNKVFSDYNRENKKAKSDFATIFQYLENIRVDNFDLAIDFKCTRDCITTIPNNKRVYTRKNGTTTICNSDGECIVNADDYTQYVGKHQTHGFLKIYNKTIESKLPFDCTRVEYTIFIDELKNKDYRWSPVLIRDMNNQECIPEDISSSLLLIADMMKQFQDPTKYFTRLTYYQQQKIKPIVFGGYKELGSLNTAAWFKSILAEIQQYCNGDIVKDFKPHKFLRPDVEYRLYMRKKFISKFYKIKADGQRDYVLRYAFDEEQLIQLDNDDFNAGILHLLSLEEDMQDTIDHYKPFNISLHNEKPLYERSEALNKGFMPVDDTILDDIPFD